MRMISLAFPAPFFAVSSIRVVGRGEPCERDVELRELRAAGLHRLDFAKHLAEAVYDAGGDSDARAPFRVRGHPKEQAIGAPEFAGWNRRGVGVLADLAELARGSATEHLRWKDQRVGAVDVGDVDVVRGLVDRCAFRGKDVEVELDAAGIGVEHGRLVAERSERRAWRTQFPLEEHRAFLRRHAQRHDRGLRERARPAPEAPPAPR